MKVLAIETATAWQSVAVMEDERVLARADQRVAGTHGRTLVPTIDRLLTESAVGLRDLDGFAVSIGPGSFTGLRVGLATVLGFRLVTGRPIAAVPTLEGLAWNRRGERLPLCPVLPARTGEVYWALYHWQGEEPQTIVAPRVDRPAAIGSQVQDGVHGAVMVLGEGWLRYRDEILAGWEGPRPQEAPADGHRPSAVSVGLAGQARLRAGLEAGDSVVPLYVQRAEAERVWDAKRRREVPEGRP